MPLKNDKRPFSEDTVRALADLGILADEALNHASYVGDVELSNELEARAQHLEKVLRRLDGLARGHLNTIDFLTGKLP